MKPFSPATSPWFASRLWFTNLGFASLWFASLPLLAATLDVSVRDAAGAPVDNAVVYAMRAGGAPPERPAAAVTAPAMDQKNQQFVPYVLPVRTGSAVLFPNSDNIQHNVYSFSTAKPIDLKLFGRNKIHQVQFDQPGVVALGCNIHDWMLGFVLVLDTPYFARTGRSGMVSLRDLPAGEYTLHVWQPNLQDGDQPQQKLILGAADAGSAELKVKALKPDRRKPTPSNPFYNN